MGHTWKVIFQEDTEMPVKTKLQEKPSAQNSRKPIEKSLTHEAARLSDTQEEMKWCMALHTRFS